MFNFLVVGEGFAMRSAVMSKFVERSLVNEANEGKGKSKNIRKSDPSPLLRLYVTIFLTFFSCEIARQKQEIFDAIYNLMKDAQQWRTQIVFSTSCTDDDAVNVPGGKKAPLLSKKRKKGERKYGKEADSLTSLSFRNDQCTSEHRPLFFGVIQE